MKYVEESSFVRTLAFTFRVFIGLISCTSFASIPTAEQKLCQSAHTLNLAGANRNISEGPNSSLVKYYGNINKEISRVVDKQCKDKNLNYHKILISAQNTCSIQCEKIEKSLLNWNQIVSECKSGCDMRYISTLNFYEGYHQGLLASRKNDN